MAASDSAAAAVAADAAEAVASRRFGPGLQADGVLGVAVAISPVAILAFRSPPGAAGAQAAQQAVQHDGLLSGRIVWTGSRARHRWPTPLHGHPSANTIAAEASGMRFRRPYGQAGASRGGAAPPSARVWSNQRQIAPRPRRTASEVAATCRPRRRAQQPLRALERHAGDLSSRR